MAPEIETEETIPAADTPSSQLQPQYLFLIRHGDRWDYSNPSWKQLPGKRTGDSPLSTLGHKQASEVGIWIANFFQKHNLSPITSTSSETTNDHDDEHGGDGLVWLSSPFLRCLQTSDDALNAATSINKDFDLTRINVEYSIFEWDGHDGSWHADLPSVVTERQHYFPRIDLKYKSVFVPPLPEPRSKFFDRCQKAVDLINTKFPFRSGQVIVCVSHAAGCLALAQAFSGRPLNEITPAGPCSIYGFTRGSDAASWTLDDHDQKSPESLNGYTSHLSDMGTATKPWHNFGDGTTKFYTGPPTSRFAPSKSSSPLAPPPPPPSNSNK